MTVAETILALHRFEPDARVWVQKMGVPEGMELKAIASIKELTEPITTDNAHEGDAVLKVGSILG